MVRFVALAALLAATASTRSVSAFSPVATNTPSIDSTSSSASALSVGYGNGYYDYDAPVPYKPVRRGRPNVLDREIVVDDNCYLGAYGQFDECVDYDPPLSSTYKPLFNGGRGRYANSHNSNNKQLGYNGYGRSSYSQSSTYKPLFNNNRGYQQHPQNARRFDNNYGGYRSGRLSDQGKGFSRGGGLALASSNSRSSANGFYDRYGRWVSDRSNTGYNKSTNGYRQNQRYGGRTGRLSDQGKRYDRPGYSYDGRRGGRTGRLSDQGKRYDDDGYGYNDRGYGNQYRGRNSYGNSYRRNKSDKYSGGVTSNYRDSPAYREQSSTYKPLFGNNKTYLPERRDRRGGY